VSAVDAFRAQFPVLERWAYLNAGSDGPIPTRGAEAAQERVRRELEDGRLGKPFFEELFRLLRELRTGYAAVLGCEPAAVAVTRSTTDGVNVVLSGLDLRPGDEVVTTDEEHPGVLAPLAVAHRRRGVEVKVVPFGEIAEHVEATTRLVVCSHVSWVSGSVADVAALAATGVPLLLDGAQALGAIPVDVGALGCDWYAAAGQKWLCGPDQTGSLYVRPERLEETALSWPSYLSLADPARPLALEPHPGAARYDMGVSGPALEWALASLAVLADAGWEWIFERSATLADQLATLLSERGLEVLPRGRSTLVTWRSPEAAAAAARLMEDHISVRFIPGRGVVRASVGAWCTEDELERLAALAA
jgi:selenocysteine lyase/cysteine desulfurase